MSNPNIPNITPSISLSTARTIPLLLSSIELEELALAHLMNAEAEKLQFILGTITPPPATTFTPATVSFSNLLSVDASVQRTLRDVIKKELLLEFKFENVLDLIGTLPVFRTQTFTFTDPGLHQLIIPLGATLARIQAIGAAGGKGAFDSITTIGGNGASEQGDFSIVPGETLTILVGQKGGDGVPDGSDAGGGGGGGSFIWRGNNLFFNNATDTSLLVAVGGGGGGGAAIPGLPATTNQNGNDGNPGGAGGTGGTPGDDIFGGSGGFGGGGGTGEAGGGGGGFSGGGGGNSRNGGGGGGSFNVGSNQINISGVGTGNGQVTISFFG